MKQRGAICVVLAAVLWGLISPFVRQLSARGMDSLQICAIRFLLAAVLLLGWILVRDRAALRIRLRDLWCFVGTGIVSLAFFSWCYFTTIRVSEVSIAVVLLYTAPVFVILLSALLFGERITPWKLLALALTFLGTVLVAGLLGGGYTLTLQVFCIGLGSGLGYGLYSIFGRYALERGYGSLTITFYTVLLAGVGVLPLSKPTALVVSLEPGILLWGLGIAAVCTAVPYLLYTLGLSRMESGKAAILTTVEPLVGAVIGIAFYQESTNPVKLLGMGCIFAAVVLLNLLEGGKRE